MPRSLFRKEAIDAQREKFLGEASLAQPVRMWIYTATAVAVAVIVVAVAVWGQYTRRERVQGYLSSATGAAVVRMPDAGTVAELMIKEGDVVVSGAPLARLTVDKSGVNDARGNEAVMRELETRKTLLEQEREQVDTLGQQQVVQAKQRVTNLQGDIRQADIEISLQNDRLASARSIAKLWKDLQGQQYVSDIYIQQKQDDAKEQEIKVQNLNRQRAVIEGNLATARSEIPEAQSRTRTP
jgi:membrane fusion protein